MITPTNTEMTSSPKPKKRNSFWRKAGKWLSGIGKGIKSLFNKSTGADLTSAERQTMEWNAEQAELNRSFQSAEAEKARQWQEDYYNQYESPQARIRQYEDAGLNPALLYGSQLGSGSVPSISVPAGDSASVGMPSSGAGDLLSFIGEMMSMKSLINKNNADAAKANAEADNVKQKTEWDPKLWQSELDKNEATTSNLLAGVNKALAEIDKIDQDIRESESRFKVNEKQADLILSQTGKTAIEAANEALKSKGIEANNRLVAQQVLTEAAKTAFTKAQEHLTNTEAVKVKFEAIEQIIDDAIYQSTGWKHGSSQWDLLFLGIQDTFTHEMNADGIASMVQRLFK